MSWVYEYYWGASSLKPAEAKVAENSAQKEEEDKAALSNDSDLLIPEEVVSGDGRVDTSIDQQPSFFFDHASRIEHVDDNL